MRVRLASGVLATGIALLVASCGPSGGAARGANADAKALLAQLPARYQAANLANGKAVFVQCRSCHTIVPEGADMTGPALYGVFGRKAASKPGYAYSTAMTATTFSWDADHLDAWLTKPRDYLPGTKMTFVGLADPSDRRDVIAWLKVASSGGPQ